MQNPIFTIGYGSRSIDQFISTLRNYNIQFVIDVRSRPYSKFRPEFSKEQLKHLLRSQSIQYVFMGDTLGGQPADAECYEDGKVKYDICKQKPFFMDGLNRLKNAYSQNLLVTLMCSEGKPQDCHRCKLIGESLVEQGMNVTHIDEKGNLKSHDEVISILTGGQLPLLDSFEFTSRKKYSVSHQPSFEVS